MGLLRAEFYKLARHALLRWIAVALLALVFLRGVVWPPDPDLPWSGLWSTSLIVIAIVLLMAVTLGQEFSEGTFRSLASRGVPRWWLLLSKFVVVVLVAGLCLVVIEGLAVLLGVRPRLNWGELLRAWLSLWPYASSIMLLTVLTRNGGLALVVGVMWVALELSLGMLIILLVMVSGETGLLSFSADGILGMLYQWTLSYNSTNWTYLSQALRAPGSMGGLLLMMPRSPLYSSLVLAAFTLLGVTLSIAATYRRDVTEVQEGRKGLLSLVRRRGRGKEQAAARPSGDVLPAWTGRGPTIARLLRANFFKLGRTSLVKIGMAVSLLFPLTLWAATSVLKAGGFQDFLFNPGPEGAAPLAITASLLAVGPLATVLGILAVSNELSLGTRRAELARGITGLQCIVSQSLALVLTIGALFAFLMGVTLLLGLKVAGAFPVGDAALAVLVAMLATGAYVGAVQVGGAWLRSPLGAILVGIGFLLADWVAILAPGLMLPDPGSLLDLGRYAVFANTFALANRGQIIGVGVEWQHLGLLEAGLLLLGYAVVLHGLAVLIVRVRDV